MMAKPTERAAFGNTAGDYARHRAGFPASFFEKVAHRDIGLPGQRIADLGTGTGTLARGFAYRGANVTGVDPDTDMLAEAQRLANEAGHEIVFKEATAEATGLEDASQDVVAAGQCWHWFDHDKVLDEIRRVLKPEGRVLIAHFDWLPLKGNVVEATEQLILEFNPKWRAAGGSGIYPQWVKQLDASGFHELETFSYDLPQPYSPDAWRGRIRASAGIAILDDEKRAAFDQALADMLSQQFPQDVLQIPHRVFAVIAKTPL